jgi:D-aminopeptidase
VLRDGEVLVRHAWGWANAEQRIPFTSRTLFRMCSVTKQFTCGLVLDAFPDPTVLDENVRAHLPQMDGEKPTALHLCHNQSGLCDYWAMAMLHGASAESQFGDIEAKAVIGATRTLQFSPGTRYSYSNQNFRILSDILEARLDRSFADQLRTRIFDPVGMETAFVAAETTAMPDGTEGYEGSQTTGFRPAVNRIRWTGDAGLGASLDDMIAWERHIDVARDDAHGLYRRLSAPVHFADGALAQYGFGLSRRTEFGRLVTGHGGALRGWRSHRLYIPSERLSVVVMFNHLTDAHAAALDVVAAVLGEERPTPDESIPTPSWAGAYIEPETGLSARIEAVQDGRVTLQFGHTPEQLDLVAGGTADRGSTQLRSTEDGLQMERPQENQSTLLRPCVAGGTLDVAGRYRCAETDCHLDVTDAGGVLYGSFSGFLGKGRMELLIPIGQDLWALPCPRSLDHTPPGDWTLAFERDESGLVGAVRVGCWLARGLVYARAKVAR